MMQLAGVYTAGFDRSQSGHHQCFRGTRAYPLQSGPVFGMDRDRVFKQPHSLNPALTSRPLDPYDEFMPGSLLMGSQPNSGRLPLLDGCQL